MKTRHILSLAILGLLLPNCHAQTAPAAVRTAFSNLHSEVASPEWEKEGSNWEAEYEVAGMEHSTILAADGSLVAEEQEMKVTELPTAIHEHLKGQKITEAAKITYADGHVEWEAEVGHSDHLFDGNGKPLGTEDEDGDEDED